MISESQIGMEIGHFSKTVTTFLCSNLFTRVNEKSNAAI